MSSTSIISKFDKIDNICLTNKKQSSILPKNKNNKFIKSYPHQKHSSISYFNQGNSYSCFDVNSYKNSINNNSYFTYKNINSLEKTNKDFFDKQITITKTLSKIFSNYDCLPQNGSYSNQIKSTFANNQNNSIVSSDITVDNLNYNKPKTINNNNKYNKDFNLNNTDGFSKLSNQVLIKENYLNSIKYIQNKDYIDKKTNNSNILVNKKLDSISNNNKNTKLKSNINISSKNNKKVIFNKYQSNFIDNNFKNSIKKKSYKTLIKKLKKSHIIKISNYNTYKKEVSNNSLSAITNRTNYIDTNTNEHNKHELNDQTNNKYFFNSQDSNNNTVLQSKVMYGIINEFTNSVITEKKKSILDNIPIDFNYDLNKEKSKNNISLINFDKNQFFKKKALTKKNTIINLSNNENNAFKVSNIKKNSIVFHNIADKKITNLKKNLKVNKVTKSVKINSIVKNNINQEHANQSNMQLINNDSNENNKDTLQNNCVFNNTEKTEPNNNSTINIKNINKSKASNFFNKLNKRRQSKIFNYNNAIIKCFGISSCINKLYRSFNEKNDSKLNQLDTSNINKKNCVELNQYLLNNTKNDSNNVTTKLNNEQSSTKLIKSSQYSNKLFKKTLNLSNSFYNNVNKSINEKCKEKTLLDTNVKKENKLYQSILDIPTGPYEDVNVVGVHNKVNLNNVKRVIKLNEIYKNKNCLSQLMDYSNPKEYKLQKEVIDYELSKVLKKKYNSNIKLNFSKTTHEKFKSVTGTYFGVNC